MDGCASASAAAPATAGGGGGAAVPIDFGRTWQQKLAAQMPPRPPPLPVWQQLTDSRVFVGLCAGVLAFLALLLLRPPLVQGRHDDGVEGATLSVPKLLFWSSATAVLVWVAPWLWAAIASAASSSSSSSSGAVASCAAPASSCVPAAMPPPADVTLPPPPLPPPPA